jgi:hypothetical protein
MSQKLVLDFLGVDTLPLDISAIEQNLQDLSTLGAILNHERFYSCHLAEPKVQIIDLMKTTLSSHHEDLPTDVLKTALTAMSKIDTEGKWDPLDVRIVYGNFMYFVIGQDVLGKNSGGNDVQYDIIWSAVTILENFNCYRLPLLKEKLSILTTKRSKRAMEIRKLIRELDLMK